MALKQFDPSGTGLLVRALTKDLQARFANLKRALLRLVVEEDAFDLASGKPTPGAAPTLNKRFRFSTAAEKMKGFESWLDGQIKAEILAEDRSGDGAVTGTKYIRSAYKEALVSTYRATHKGAKAPKGIGGSQDEFLKDTFQAAEAQSKLALLSTRMYSSLKDISSTMDAKMSRILAQGIADGKNPREVGRQMAKEVDDMSKVRAVRIARTEMVHAHAEGQLDGFEALQIEGLEVMAEWLTTPDRRLCPKCAELSGVVLTVKEARGLLPRHPNCILPGTMIQGKIELALKAWYSGEVVQLSSSDGSNFSVTIHHPILTDRGVIFAGDLRKGDNLLSYGRDVGSLVPTLSEFDEQNGPAEIEQLYLAWEAGGRKEVPALAFNFDSDEVNMADKVYVVGPDLARTVLESPASEFNGNLDLPDSSDCGMCGLGLELPLSKIHASPLDEFSLRPTSHQAPAMDGSPDDLFREAVGGHEFKDGTAIDVVNQDRLRHIVVGMGGADLNTRLPQSARKCSFAYAEFLSELLESNPGCISFANVIDVKFSHYDGPVYDVQTATGYLLADSTLIGNCRCAWMPADVGEPKKGQIRSKAGKEAAIERSVRLERPKADSAEAFKLSRWLGADLKPVAPPKPIESLPMFAPSEALWGHQPTGVMRWMGKDGWTSKEAARVLKELGVESADATVSIQVKAGAKGLRGAAADLTEEQAAILRARRLGPSVKPPLPPVIVPPSVDDIYEAHRLLVVEEGTAAGTNSEVMILVDQSGKVVGKSIGNAHVGTVDFPPVPELQSGAPRSLTAIHNHPDNRGLSAPDLKAFRSRPGLGRVEAVTHDGTVYRATLVGDADELDRAVTAFAKEVNNSILEKSIAMGDLSEEQRLALRKLRVDLMEGAAGEMEKKGFIRLETFRLRKAPSVIPPPIVVPPIPPVIVPIAPPLPPIAPPPIPPLPPTGGLVAIPEIRQPATSVARWLGKEGFSFQDARKISDEMGLKISDATLKTQLSAGAKGLRGPAATLTEAQAAALRMRKGYSLQPGQTIRPLVIKPPRLPKVKPPTVPPPAAAAKATGLPPGVVKWDSSNEKMLEVLQKNEEIESIMKQLPDITFEVAKLQKMKEDADAIALKLRKGYWAIMDNPEKINDPVRVEFLKATGISRDAEIRLEYAKAKASEQIHKLLELPEAERMSFKLNDSTNLRELVHYTDGSMKQGDEVYKKPGVVYKEKLNEATKFLEKVTRKTGRAAGDASEMVLETKAFKKNSDRAFYSNGHGAAKPAVHLADNDDVRVYVHEMLHHYEEAVPGAKTRSNAFLQERISKAGTKSQSMKKLFRGNYAENEMGNDDGFGKFWGDKSNSAFYAGKTYSDRSTEIVSMAGQELYRDAAGLATKDPELFRFIVGFLRGSY